jgi:hypothetical protein
MDKNDLAELLNGASAEEVDRIHRVLHEWSVGPDSSFPVQLALLTRAQWRSAATVPRVMNDSRKLIELHLADYRRQSKTVVDDFFNIAGQQTAELKTAVEINVQTTRHAAEQIQLQLADAEAVAKQVKSLMESAASEWKGIKTSTTAQCARLEQVTNHLNTRFSWRVLLTALLWFSLAIALGVLFGHYCWTH